ncbi:11952_t:CDS:10 [Acaulospora morrowiae]|uniref:11952_t:CDS:1 n=1 Tax=Acaulospora morrowiae TaxID=94023 RepID=A0A9N8WAE5_9GLOM|nr:11952_t:CDS:10 [Acaulospora morrowiae]
MISQFFILSSQRGDTLIFRDFRHDTPRDTPDLLLDKLMTWHKENGSEQDPPPVFNVDGVQLIFITVQELYFVCATRFNVSPFMTFELLGRITTLIKDFCGSLSEEIIRLNSGLIYELLDEVIDYGYPQTTSTNQLKLCVYEEPVLIKRENIIMNSLAKLKPPGINMGNSSNRPITLRDEKSNEIFIDGMTVQAEIDGAIQVRSYLQGYPEISLGLNSNIVLGRDSEITDERHGIIFDDYKFHDSVDSSDFEEHRRITIFPPEGEISAMNYRMSGDISLPFRVFPLVLHVPGHPDRMDITVRIRADFPEDKIATKCTVIVPLPRNTQSVSHELLDGSADQSAQYESRTRKFNWTINKLRGGAEKSIKIKITGATSFSSVAQLEVGPINLEFDIQNYTCSNLQIRRLKVYEKNNALVPQRWFAEFPLSSKV